MLSSMCRSCWALSIAVVASPRDALGAKLNEIVTTGNWPCRLMESGELCSSKCAIALSGTAEPLLPAAGAGLADPAVPVAAVLVGVFDEDERMDAPPAPARFAIGDRT